MQKRAFSKSAKAYSLTQIFLLVSMIFATSFLLGESLGFASAFTPDSSTKITGTFVDGVFQRSASGAYELDTSTMIARNTVGGNNFRIIENGGVYQVGARVDAVSTPAVTTNPASANNLNLINKDVTTNNGGIIRYDADGKPLAAVPPATTSGTGNAGYNYDFYGMFQTKSFFMGNMIQGVQYALGAVGVVALIGSLVGIRADDTKAIQKSVAAGLLTYKALVGAFGKDIAVQGGKYTGSFGSVFTNAQAGWIGLGVAIAVFVLTYKKEKQQLVTFQCQPFEPALGGSKCEDCNKDPFKPCSEYRCKSLGQACQLLNSGTSNEKCAWINPRDVTSPTITPWNSALRPTGLKYTPDNAVRPGTRGVKIVSTSSDGCLPAFTALQFGIQTNEPAQCKIASTYGINYSSMYDFGGSSYYQYNHTQIMRLPSPNSTDGDLSPMLRNDGYFSMYIQCQDANGNRNVDLYSVSFCVSKAPDTTPPRIEGTSITDNSPVQANADSTPIEVYTNEPADCKWSKQDKSFSDMENSMRCATDANQINANLQYTCVGNLTGIIDMQENSFFFRCKDKPASPENERNTMTQSYPLTLRGTQELNIVLSGPNSTIFSSTNVVEVDLFVETDDGADTGNATCYFSSTGSRDSFVEMFETNRVFHKQPLSLTEGSYSYFFRCVDAGGNFAENKTDFKVEVDNSAPMVTRVYKEGAILKVVTNEDAQCAYSVTSCNYQFNDGTKLSYISANKRNEHSTDWKINTPYYIKCKDKYDNEPSPNSCSIIASGLDLGIRAR